MICRRDELTRQVFNELKYSLYMNIYQVSIYVHLRTSVFNMVLRAGLSVEVLNFVDIICTIGCCGI